MGECDQQDLDPKYIEFWPRAMLVTTTATISSVNSARTLPAGSPSGGQFLGESSSFVITESLLKSRW